jgi:AraC-like DNA-binding protein
LVDLRGTTHCVTPYAHFDVFYNPRREESFATRPGQLELSAYRHLMQPGLEVLKHGRPPVKFSAPSPHFTETWVAMVRGWRSADALGRLEADQVLGQLLLQLLRHRHEQAGRGEVGLAAYSLGWIPSYLSTHLAGPVSVQDMAGRAGLSASRFQVVFRSIYGVSPGRYLIEMRVRHAAELLRDTNWTLAHIAALCGFADVHHFAKTFKRITGRTPGQHRRG